MKRLRAAMVWAAIFALYLQLAAAALCPGGPSSAMAAGRGASPICHSQADDGTGDDGGGPDRPAHGCPFCTLHGDAGLAVAAPSPRPVRPVAVAAERPRPPSLPAPSRPRRRTAGAPRGPPTAA